MAETRGFEPPVPLSEYNDLANRRLQPLGHVSSAPAYSCHGAERQGSATGCAHSIRRSANRPAKRAYGRRSMRPGALAAKAEIVGVGLAHGGPRLGLGDLVGQAVTLGVGDGLVLCLEGQPDLGFHVARAGPAHQRVDLPRHLGLELEHPVLGAGGPGLHRRLGGLEDAGNHAGALSISGASGDSRHYAAFLREHVGL